MAERNGWTPTEKKIVDALSDGQLHHRRALLALIDSEAEPNNLNVHLTNIRAKLPIHRQIICALRHRQIHYVMCRKLRND